MSTGCRIFHAMLYYMQRAFVSQLTSTPITRPVLHIHTHTHTSVHNMAIKYLFSTGLLFLFLLFYFLRIHDDFARQQSEASKKTRAPRDTTIIPNRCRRYDENTIVTTR